MKIKKAEIMNTVRTFAAVAKFSGGDDLVHFAPDRLSVRSYLIDIDQVIPGINFEATVSAKFLHNVLRDMANGDIDIRDTKTGIKITDGVRKSTLKKKDVSDDSLLSVDYDSMQVLPTGFWNILSMSVFNGTGNKGIQFLGNNAVNKTQTEILIFDVESPVFYLAADQVKILLDLGTSYETKILIEDNTLSFSDLTTTVRCRRGRVPAGITSAGLAKFREKLVTKSKPLFSEVIPENITGALKHVANFGVEDEETGKSIVLSFSKGNKQVTLYGENLAGSFEETIGIEYSGEYDISVSLSISVLASLVGKSFTLMESDQTGYYWLTSEDPDTGLLYIGGGKKK